MILNVIAALLLILSASNAFHFDKIKLGWMFVFGAILNLFCFLDAITIKSVTVAFLLLGMNIIWFVCIIKEIFKKKEVEKE